MKYYGIIGILCILVLAGCTPPTGAIVAESEAASIVEILPGGEFDLEAKVIRKEIKGTDVEMFGYNGLVPGPVLKVKQNSNITITFKNSLDAPTTVHWHGVRLENKYDGSPNITQEPVLPGESFVYELTFPDEGAYWYHPHIREDEQQELGLYGSIIVEPAQENYYNPVDREEIVFLDDLRMSDGQIESFSNETNYALMGRFGNQMLINGMTTYSLDVEAGNIVRFYLIDSANTRIFNMSIENTKLKVVGGDSGLYEKEFFADSVVISPSERTIVEVLFDKPGSYRLMHTNPHKTYELGVINVRGSEKKRDEFDILREHSFISESMDHMRAYFDAPPDIEIDLTVEMSEMMMNMMSEMEEGEMKQMNKSMSEMEEGEMKQMNKSMSEMEEGEMKQMNKSMTGMMGHDMSKEGLEWEDGMSKMNAASTNKNMKWIMRDKKTGKENMDLGYKARVGDIKKVRLFNDPESAHPMQHPIHIHGQRFLVLKINGQENTNLVWKDTVLVPKGATVDILVDFTNPGDWMFHCHIAEHVESGMMGVFEVLA